MSDIVNQPNENTTINPVDGLAPMTTCQIRLKAAEIIKERGWTKGIVMRDSGEVCLIGALAIAAGFKMTGPNGSDFKTTSMLKNKRPIRNAWMAMGFNDSDPRKSPIAWNDSSRRRKSEVLARLRDGCTEAK